MDGRIERIFVPSDGASIVVVLAGGSAEVASEVVVLDTAAATETGRFQRTAIAQIADAGAGTVALADSRGVAFVDTTTAAVTTTVELEGPALGLAFVTNLDKDRLYVTYMAPGGPRVAKVVAPGGGGTPSLESTFQLPGPSAGWVGYDLATEMVHVLGSNPDSGAPTVYVIEPHGDAVYADAALPFAPAAIVLDENQRYPSSDHEQLLAFEGDGSAATVDTGQHAFAWRLPGRARRGAHGRSSSTSSPASCSGAARSPSSWAASSPLDGMLFAQSRIGMNDAYVGLGIVAAYTLFAALWRWPGGSRRHWLAFAVGMPLIGGFLGLRPGLEVGRRVRDRRPSAS